MTGQSLFYMRETSLKHRILAIAEEQGVAQAAYALKLLQSQGELTIASTGKDEATGKLVTHTYRVEGPVMLFLTTTAVEVDEELLSRCLLLTVNESRDQTRAIHQVQRSRRTLAGLISKTERAAIERLHQNAQRLLRPLPVVNPHAERLAFADGAPRTRRDHEKYLSLIDAVTLLHQHQRPRKTLEHAGQLIEYLEATEADIALADRGLRRRSRERRAHRRRRRALHAPAVARGAGVQPHAAARASGSPGRDGIPHPVRRRPGPQLRLRDRE
jgi:hypothetical protein